MPTQKWKDKNPEKVKQYRRDYYYRNRNNEKNRVLKRKKEIIVKFKQWKLDNNVKCARCPEDHPATLHFHHRDPSKKEYLISKMVGNGMSWEKILEEIEKCDILCANCHAKEHYIENTC